MIPLLAEFVGAAATQKGGGSPYSAPAISPGLDPGRYAYELWFNKQRRKEAQANMDREFNEGKREFDVSAGLKGRELTQKQRDAERNFGFAGLDYLTKTPDIAMTRFRNLMYRGR